MSDIDGGAPAPSESTSAPIEQVTHTPEPVSTEREPAPKPEPKADEPSKPVSTRDALAKARETVEKREAKVEKPQEKAAPIKDAGPTRSEDGKFAVKEGKPDAQANTGRADGEQKGDSGTQVPATPEVRKSGLNAPDRFSPQAKAVWDSAPEELKAETHRALTELQQGYEKHREAAQSYEGVRKYDQMARESGTTLDAALERYVNAETMLRQDPIRGLEHLCQNMGISLRQVAAHVMGQTPDQQSQQADRVINELRQELSGLKQQLGGVTGHLQTQQQQAKYSEVETFARENPRFDELSDTIATLLSKGVANNLSEAYSMADRLNPAAVQAPATAPAAPVIDLTPQTQKGSKSISGAPSAGSDPATSKQPSSSIKEAIRRAAARAG